MDCSAPGLPVHQQLLEFAQTRIFDPKPNLKKKILGIQLKPFLVALHSDSSLTALRSASHETSLKWVSSLRGAKMWYENCKAGLVQGHGFPWNQALWRLAESPPTSVQIPVAG